MSNLQLRERSGEVNSKDKLVQFLYILMRDHLPPGTVEGIIRDHVESLPHRPASEIYFTNGWLAKYAEDIRDRLTNKETL